MRLSLPSSCVQCAGPLHPWVAFCFLLASCGVDDAALRPALTRRLLEPELLSEACGVPPADLGVPSRARLELYALSSERRWFSEIGAGRARLRYEMVDVPACEGDVTFTFDDGGEAAASPRIVDVAVSPDPP